MHTKTLFLCLLLSVPAWSALAEEVTLPHRGLTLNASLDLAAGKSVADGVIVITHGTLAHRDMEALTYLRSLFAERGYSTLAINLGLGLDNRHGMYECSVAHRHRNDDAAGEIGAWLDWLKAKGATKVVLLGHSRGGAQTALFGAERDDAAVRALVLMAPAVGENSDAASYQKRFNKPLGPVVARARQLVKDGKGATLMDKTDFLYCPGASVTAESFLSYYGPAARVDTPSLLPKIRKPVLVVVAGNDEAVVGLDSKIAPLADGKRVQMKVIAGADHFFRDLFADDAVEAIDAFLKGIGY